MAHLYNLLSEIISNPKLTDYHADSRRFFDYLISVPYLSIKADISFSDGFVKRKEIPVIYRWCEIYRNSIQSKFYQLQDWYKNNKTDITFLSLTCSSKNRSIDDCFKIIKESRIKLMKAIRRIIKHKFDYVWVFEPHESGYPHYHMILFHELKEVAQIRLRYLWKRYEAGSFEHGLDFEVREKQENIKNIKNYIISYLGKSWMESGSKYKKSPWTSQQFLFNMTVWKSQHRLWGSSRHLSEVMAWKSEENLQVPARCFKTQIYENTSDQLLGVNWKADSELIEDCARRFDRLYLEKNKNFFAG